MRSLVGVWWSTGTTYKGLRGLRRRKKTHAKKKKSRAAAGEERASDSVDKAVSCAGK